MAYTGVSIIDYLNSVGQPSDYTSRSKLATEKGIQNYRGTAEQNTQLLNLIRTSPKQPTTESIQEGINKAQETFNNIKIQASPLLTPNIPTPPTPPTPVQPIKPTVQAETTGVPQLDELYNTLKEYVSQNTINPNIQLTPADLQRFYDQASSEINPYYASKITAIKDDLSKNIGILQKQFEIKKKQTETEFKRDVSGVRESAAGAGTTFSGGRGATERGLSSLYGTNLESSALSSESQIGGALRSAEGTIGSRNIQDLGISPFVSANPSLEGRGGFTTGRTLSFAPTGGVTGSIEYQQRGDIRNMQDLLANEEIKKRSMTTPTIFK